MALNWLWSNKCGEAVIKQNWNGEDHIFTVSLYEGNAFLIFIHEYKDAETGKDMYQLHDFWADETHMKRMLGIDKKWKDTYGTNHEKDIVKITFYKDKCRHLKKIVSAMAEAFDNLEIEILATAPEKKEENE